MARGGRETRRTGKCHGASGVEKKTFRLRESRVRPGKNGLEGRLDQRKHKRQRREEETKVETLLRFKVEEKCMWSQERGKQKEMKEEVMHE